MASDPLAAIERRRTLRVSRIDEGRDFRCFNDFIVASPKQFPNFCWSLAAHVITTALKFSNRLVSQFFQRFLARHVSHRSVLYFARRIIILS